MLNNWNSFLIQNGAHFDGSELLSFKQTEDFTAWQNGFAAPLTGLGQIAAVGEQSAEFLHNQLSNDVKNLSPDEVRLAGYCTPKGRLLATMLMWREGEQYLLQLSQPLLPGILKRLKMFVMRSKTVLSDVSETWVALGVGGMAADGVLKRWFPVLPEVPYTKVSNGFGCLIRVSDGGGAARYQWLTSEENAQQIWPELTQTLAAAPPRIWRLGDIYAGVPQVQAETQEQFVPQMINFELVGGVNFKKGCYPGQEIVARSQYLGKLKRRMQFAQVDAPQVNAGMEVFSLDDPEQACGMVVNAEKDEAKVGEQRFSCLVEMKTALLASEVHLGSCSGPILRFGEVPYAIP